MDADPTWLPLNGQRYARTFSRDVSLSSDVVLVFDVSLVPGHRADSSGPEALRSKLSLLPDALTGRWARTQRRRRLAGDQSAASSDTTLKARLWRRMQPRPCGPYRSVVAVSDGIDMVVAAGPGSPTASVTMELLAAHGVQRVVSVGTAAATSDFTSDGQVCLIAEATLAAATSPYQQEERPRSGPLFDHLREATDALAPALTTLWPFRVDASEVAMHRGAVIEMEAATLHAVADTVGVEVESVVVVSDRYREGEWQLGDAPRTQSGLERAVDIAVAAMDATR